ncbi:MAG: DNA repair protein RecO [Desulfatirhabdiaceae bacterium]
MPCFSAKAIVLRKIEFGDADLIITLFSSDRGKLTAIAKGAKKSRKRFSGVLELFSTLNIVSEESRGRGIPILQEASLIYPFVNIRSKIEKTAYASYWAEIVNVWMEDGQKQPELYSLLEFSLDALDTDQMTAEILSVFFQIQFMKLCGFGPTLFHCTGCCQDMMETQRPYMAVDIARGGILCQDCLPKSFSCQSLSMGTIKFLQWMEKADRIRAARLRPTTRSINEGLDFLESFVPHHLGKPLHSLAFLRQLRASSVNRNQ